jgi:hypothetical protein
MAGVAFVMLAITTAGGQYVAVKILPIQQKLNTVSNVASREGTSDFRQRLLMLSAALRNSDTWPARWFVDAEPAKQAMRDILLRSPVFGGTFAAGSWDAKGRSIIRLDKGKLLVHDLMTGQNGKPSDLPDSPEPNIPPSVGLLARADGGRELVAFRSYSAKVLTGQEGSTLAENSFTLPKDYLQPGHDDAPTAVIFIPRADILRDHLRIIFMRFLQTTINGFGVLQLSSTADGQLAPTSSGKVMLDWDPIRQQAFRQPVLAEDCDVYAFLGKEDQSYRVLFGRFGEKASRSENFDNPLPLGAVAVARGCDSVLARDDTNLHVIPLQHRPADSQEQSFPLAALGDARIMIAPGAAQVPPMFAAAPLTKKRGWRVAWPTSGGLALVDVTLNEDTPIQLLNGTQMLTGLDSAYVFGSLSLSPDASYVLMTQQQTFQALRLQLRAFDLRLDKRRQDLAKLTSTPELVREACRIAVFQDGNNQLTATERVTWLGDRDAPQLCAGTGE